MKTQTVRLAQNNMVTHRENEKGNTIPRAAARETIFLVLLKESHKLKLIHIVL